MHNALLDYADLISLLTAVGTFVAIVAGVVELIKARREHVRAKEQSSAVSTRRDQRCLSPAARTLCPIPPSRHLPGRKSPPTSA